MPWLTKFQRSFRAPRSKLWRVKLARLMPTARSYDGSVLDFRNKPRTGRSLGWNKTYTQGPLALRSSLPDVILVCAPAHSPAHDCLRCHRGRDIRAWRCLQMRRGSAREKKRLACNFLVSDVPIEQFGFLWMQSVAAFGLS